MRKIIERLKHKRSQLGFSLVEVLVGGLVLVVGLLALSQLFASSASRILDSDIRSVLHQVANEEMESIRALPYTKVGLTVGPPPNGSLEASEYRQVDAVRVKVDRAVTFIKDPGDSSPYYSNYRKVTLTVSVVDDEDNVKPGIAPVELVSYVAGGATGGAILIKVQDSQGLPVEGARYVITNPTLGINFNEAWQVTDELGSVLVPGLDVDPSGAYEVSVDKANYSEDSKGQLTVLEAGLQEVILTIDREAAMTIRLVDLSTGLNYTHAVNASVSGPQGYSFIGTIEVGGRRLSGLRFSTSGDPYIVRLLSGQGFDTAQRNVALPAGADQEEVFNIMPYSATTTTTLPATTTTIAGTTTTLQGTGSLRVTVRRSNGSALGTTADIQLDTVKKSSSNNIVLFENLQFDTYDLVVSAYKYVTYRGTVTVTGANTVTIYLSKQ